VGLVVVGSPNLCLATRGYENVLGRLCIYYCLGLCTIGMLIIYRTWFLLLS
jgi:hypothetical protein